jgi:hypothetical protein
LFLKGGANRFNLPQWLLLAMAGSGIWQNELLPQVQGVAYIHDIENISGGDFFFYPKGIFIIFNLLKNLKFYFDLKK